jgi:hypothetical protein
MKNLMERVFQQPANADKPTVICSPLLAQHPYPIQVHLPSLLTLSRFLFLLLINNPMLAPVMTAIFPVRLPVFMTPMILERSYRSRHMPC